MALPTAELGRLVPELSNLFTEAGRKVTMVVGLPSTADRFEESYEWCHRAAHLHSRGMLKSNSSSSTTSCDIVDLQRAELELLIGADLPLLQRLTHDVLHCFSSLTGYTRRILLDTLRVWAANPNAGAPQLARALDVHPQTFRYRMSKLRELLGDQLDDQRFVQTCQLVFTLQMSDWV